MSSSSAAQFETLHANLQKGASGWEASWVDGATPWDAGQSPPSLLKLLKSGKLPAPGPGVSALVPGALEFMTSFFYYLAHKKGVSSYI